METKQTAVDWLIENAEDFFGGLLAPSIIDQAKKMERENIIDAWDNGFANGYDLGKYNNDCNPDDGEQYYNETYKK